MDRTRFCCRSFTCCMAGLATTIAGPILVFGRLLVERALHISEMVAELPQNETDFLINDIDLPINVTAYYSIQREVSETLFYSISFMCYVTFFVVISMLLMCVCGLVKCDYNGISKSSVDFNRNSAPRISAQRTYIRPAKPKVTPRQNSTAQNTAPSNSVHQPRVVYNQQTTSKHVPTSSNACSKSQYENVFYPTSPTYTSSVFIKIE